MFCLKLRSSLNSITLSFFVIFFIFIAALFIGNKPVSADKLSDGTWDQSGSPGTTTITYTNTAALDIGSDIVLTFPGTASVDQDGTGVTITGQSSPTRSNNTLDNTITLTLDGTIDSGLSVTIAMADALTSYTASTYAQESLAINTNDSSDTPKDFGVALITNSNETTVTTQVPLFVNIAVDTTSIQLGTLSTSSVNEADQTYTVNSNNAAGITVAIVADGDLDDGFGNNINDVIDGTVDAGSEEYGISVDNVTSMTIESPFDSGDNAVPQASDNIANTGTEVSNGTFDINYKASITGTTIAGSYDQIVTVTISSNS